MRTLLFLLALLTSSFAWGMPTSLPRFEGKYSKNYHQVQPEHLKALMNSQEALPQFNGAKIDLIPVKKDERNIVHLYEKIADNTGHFYNAQGESIAEVLPEVLAKVVRDFSDVVVVLDHTSSMGDDIEEVRGILQRIQSQFNERKGIRLGMVTFSDQKNRPEIGYRAHELSRNFASLDAFLEATLLIGSKEDMYGSIVRCIQEFNWRPGVPRSIVVISDELPARKPDTEYSLEEVHRRCLATRPDTGLHTILLSKN